MRLLLPCEDVIHPRPEFNKRAPASCSPASSLDARRQFACAFHAQPCSPAAGATGTEHSQAREATESWKYDLSRRLQVALHFCNNRHNGAVKFIVHPQIRTDAQRGIAWAKSFVRRFDTSMVAWLRIDLGREYQDSRGRSYRKYRGVYGHCWYPIEASRTYSALNFGLNLPWNGGEISLWSVTDLELPERLPGRIRRGLQDRVRRRGLSQVSRPALP